MVTGTRVQIPPLLLVDAHMPDLDVLCRHGVEELGDRLLFVDGDAVALQLADERLQAEGKVLHRFTILELEVCVLLL